MKNAIEEAFLSLCLEKHGDTEITLGHDTYRNAGDGQKLEGKASKALQECLEGKRKAEQKGKK